MVTVTEPENGSRVSSVAGVERCAAEMNPTNNTTPPVMTSVGASADVSVTKTGPANVTAGASFNYSIDVSNLGPSVPSSLSVTDNLPASVSFVSASSGGVLSGSQGIWANLGNLAAGPSINRTVSVTAPPTPGSFTTL